MPFQRKFGALQTTATKSHDCDKVLDLHLATASGARQFKVGVLPHHMIVPPFMKKCDRHP